MKNTLLKENNNKMSYVSELILKKKVEEKNNNSFTYQPKSPYQVKSRRNDRKSRMKQNGWDSEHDRIDE